MKALMVLLSLSLWAPQSFAQGHDEIIKQFLEQRKHMMEDIMKAFDDDSFFNDDFFKDDIFEDLRRHGLGGFRGFNGVGNHVSVKERMEKDGTISVVITPKDENTNLDIETGEDRITIKSEVKVEEEIKGKSASKSVSMQSFTKTVAIPENYKAQAPKKEGKSIVIALVPNKDNILRPDKNGRVPIKKSPGEQTI